VLDHVGLNVSDIERSNAFYLAALAPLGEGGSWGKHGFPHVERRGSLPRARLAEVDDDGLQLGEAVEREAAADASDA
jgi:hypothetical protein